MPLMGCSGARWGALSLMVCALLSAGSARAETTAQTLIWYRSADGCPDGAGFLARLDARGVHARLAKVGDAIDFVVTLGSGADGARGLLERQTKTGTVAIRQVEGGTCDEVADGVALSLSLADVPGEHHETPAATAASPSEGAKPAESVRVTPSAEAAPVASTSAPRARWAIGAQGNVSTGIAPALLPGGTLFVDFAPGNPSLLVGSSLRLSGFGGSRGSTEGPAYRVWLLGGRLDVCPTRLGNAAIHVSPCAAVEAGVLGAGGDTGARSSSESAAWAALRAALRLQVHLGGPAALEAEVNAAEHLTRYDIVAGTPEKMLFRTAPVGLGFGVGANFTIP